MADGDPVLADALAEALADGRDVDWAALTAQASTPAERRRIEGFALLARVAGVHAAQPATGEPAPAFRDAYAPGDQWGSLRIVSRLAAGTFGTVYRAHDPALARDVALKILHWPNTTGAEAMEAVREGRLLARIRHPNVVVVYGADQRDRRVGVWMELVEGGTLEDELAARGPLPPAAVIHVAHTLASALQAVHDAGLIHRDVKTQNVMRDARDGRLVLMDFSAGREQLAREAADGPWPATLAGSPLYIAPELFADAPASARTDVYSLGVLLFRLASGWFPVDGDSLAAVARAHGAGDAARFDRLPAGTPTSLRRVIRRALAPAHERYATARALADDLPGVGGGAATRRRALIGLAGAVATLAPLGYLGLTLPARPRSHDGAAHGPSRIVLSTSSPEARALVERAESLMIANAERQPRHLGAVLQQAEGWLHEATALDGSFAYAWMLIGRALELRHGATDRWLVPREALQGFLVPLSRGLDMLASASPAERGAIEGYAHRLRAGLGPHHRDELLASARAYEAVLRPVPGDYWTLAELEHVYRRLQRDEDADRVAVMGAVYHPRALDLAAAASRVHLQRRDHQALRTVATTALDAVRDPGDSRPGPYVSLMLWAARDAWLDGDARRVLAAVREVAARHASVDNDDVGLALTSAFESLGRFGDARYAASRIRNEGRRAFRLALVDARQERWEDLRRWLEPDGVRPTEPIERYSFMYIWAGRLDDAQRLLAAYRAGRHAVSWTVIQEFEAELRLAEGKPAQALDLFAPLLVDEAAPRLRMHEFVARARLGVGDTAAALTVLEHITRAPILAASVMLSAYDWLRCLVLLAEVYRDVGRAADAARVASQARAYLAVADADHPFAARLGELP